MTRFRFASVPLPGRLDGGSDLFTRAELMRHGHQVV